MAGAHGLLVSVLLSSRAANVRSQAPPPADRITVLVLREALPPAKALAAFARRVSPAVSARTSPAPATSEPTEPAEATDSRPFIDWQSEASRVARSSAETGQQAAHDCEQSDRPGSPLPKCPKAKHKFEWHAEPKQAGFAGLLPYVRAGKRCIIGLGFVGCAIGALPEANGQLFNDMHDPDRVTSSVPSAAR